MNLHHFFIFFLLLIPFTLLSQTRLYNISEVKITKPYEQISPLGKYRYDSLSYEIARKQTNYIFEKFNYTSDDTEVQGFSCIPKTTSGTKIPVIIYNRGGTGNIGRITEEDFPDFYALAKNGFAVYASNYRYVGASGANDQIGGDDIQDVIQLFQSIKNIDFIDVDNIFMVGVSRGGLMTYKSLTHINVNAAAVIGGIADFENLTNKRPIFLTGWTDLSQDLNYKGLENILPDFIQKKEQHIHDRSAVKWADKINTPLYILHSRQDGRVPIDGTIELVKKLNTLKKEFQVKIYNQKSHSLPYSKFDSFEEIIHWFKKYIKH
ncbi:prolyl oligopeptidase family serine peptidase [Aquimarina sp. TRL1]|uniref:alpha/beta hydrolase family protein n=1 Tax=Aquimarina sp. (strain TRL1) TaxID=2736252 RepID=UPI00158D3803|nr:prolyl oligopeptidase family serine peptidase [Aquimarina sp. TRL1]QKX06676.1 prolyl oligopeptidase family serine peptidase [Aquimarina sp. TRL1]